MGIKRLLGDIGCFSAMQVVLVGALLWGYYRPELKSPMYQGTVVKHDRLARAESPRAIVIGGSSVLLGIESERIAEVTPYAPVNMGLVAGSRIDYILNEVRPTVRSGDLVILALEYHSMIVPSSAAEHEVLMSIVEQRWQNAQFFSWAHWRTLLDRGIQNHLGTTLRYSLEQLTKRPPLFLRPSRSNSKRQTERFNEYGDVLLFRTSPPKNDETSLQSPLPDVIDREVMDANIAILNRFFEDCQKKGGEVVYTYPPIPISRYTDQEAIAQEFHQILQESLKIPIINTPQSMALDSKHFFDNRYHLYGQGIRKRTNRLIRAIEKYEQTK